MARIKISSMITMLLFVMAGVFLSSSAQAQCTDSTDVDNDGIIACEDNCPAHYNPNQEDTNGDGRGDVCSHSCCGLYTGGYPGNTDCSPDGKRTLADITLLIDHTYLSKPDLCCQENGDMNYDGKRGLSDITMLIDLVYISRREFYPCSTW